MTYKLEPEIRKIVSPVVLTLPDGTKEKYESGSEACEKAFDHKYVVDEICAVDNVIEIKLELSNAPNAANWIGEEQTFF